MRSNSSLKRARCGPVFLSRGRHYCAKGERGADGVATGLQDVSWGRRGGGRRGVESGTRGMDCPGRDGCPCSEVMYDSREIYFEPRDEDLGGQMDCVLCGCHGVGRRNVVLGMERRCM